jgi:hypothetical protein
VDSPERIADPVPRSAELALISFLLSTRGLILDRTRHGGLACPVVNAIRRRARK